MRFRLFRNPEWDRQGLRRLGWLSTGLGFLAVGRAVAMAAWPEVWTVLLPAIGLPAWLFFERAYRRATSSGTPAEERRLLRRWLPAAMLGLYSLLVISLMLLLGRIALDLQLELRPWHGYATAAILILVPLWLVFDALDDPLHPGLAPVIEDLRVLCRYVLQVLGLALFADGLGLAMGNPMYSSPEQDTIWSMVPWLVSIILILLLSIGVIQHFAVSWTRRR